MRNVILGGIGGSIATSIILTPIDFVKTQQQVHQRSFLHTMKDMYYRRGLVGYWTGFRPTLFHSIPSTTIYLASYTYMHSTYMHSTYMHSTYMHSTYMHSTYMHSTYMHKETTLSTRGGIDGNSLYISLAGGMARFISVLCTSPLELLRTQYQATSSMNNRSTNLIFSSLLRSQTFYQALTLNMIRDIPFSAIYWVVLNKYKILVDGGSDSHTFVQNLFAGSISGSITALLTCPLDVLKTKCSIIETKHYNLRSLITVFVSTVKDDGLGGLFRGLGARIVRVGLGCGIMISVFEKLQEF
jgi:solute carrier family 25 protein 39/40